MRTTTAMQQLRRYGARLLALSLIGGAAYANPFTSVMDTNHEIDTANFIALPISSIDGYFPTAWGCSGAAPSPQSVIQFHRNWHCNNPDNSGSNWGNRFFGFHKQFLLGYDRYLESVGEPHIQTWVAAPNALIPPVHGGRAANTACANCTNLPSSFKVPGAGGTLDTWTSITDLGGSIVSWHNTNHGNIARAGGTGGCGGTITADMNCPSFSPRDPIFYRYHHIFDDVQDAWRTLQATDIAIVFDRSGSMSLPTSTGGTRLDAAKAAANLFADLLEDGTSHRLGMVSFSTTASSPADMSLTSVAAAPGALNTALGVISASGSTSIGDGLQKAKTLIDGGSNGRKAILLLTDGMENTNPTIATAQAGLGDTHVCSVGFGTPGSLDGPKLRDLSEIQGGIYISTPNTLELKKFFVFCFANIFDTFVGSDPIQAFPGASLVSPPTIHTAYHDEKLVFVLSWKNPVPKGSIRLSVASPTGAPVNLSDPSVESVFGPTYHIVRFKTPYRGERDGAWEARAVRPHRGFVNGFSSNSFADLAQGSALVRREIARLCPDGCRSVLYYEDEMEHETFGEHTTIYSDALYSQASRAVLGRITRPRNAADFTAALRSQRYDLIVYSSQFTEGDQPYDAQLSEILCSRIKPRTIVSDNRMTRGAQAILRCSGAIRGERRNFGLLTRKDLLPNDAKLEAPEHVQTFSYEVNPIAGSSHVQITGTNGIAAVVAQGTTGSDEEFFITSLASSSAKVKPFTYFSQYYTYESLHPTFHIPAMYWPSGGFDRVEASVDITRPTQSESRLMAEAGGEPTRIRGDALSARQAILTRFGSRIAAAAETRRFTLYDDGTNGDGTANDHYWEARIPEDFAANDGEYRLHAYFTLCKGSLCINREAEQTITVQTKLTDKTAVTTSALPPVGGRNMTRVVFVPADKSGTPLGPGFLNSLRITTEGDAKLERKAQIDQRGGYEAVVSWTSSRSDPVLLIGQPNRPKAVLRVKLSP